MHDIMFHLGLGDEGINYFLILFYSDIPSKFMNIGVTVIIKGIFFPMRGNIKIKINRPIIIGTQPIFNIFLLRISVILTYAYLSPGGFLECKMRPWKMCKCISLIIYINFWRKQYYQENVRNYWNEFGKSSIKKRN